MDMLRMSTTAATARIAAARTALDMTARLLEKRRFLKEIP